VILRSVLPCAAVVVLLAVPAAASADHRHPGWGQADAPSAPNVAAAPTTNPDGGGADAAGAAAVQVSPVPAGGADPAAVPATTPPARPAPGRPHRDDDGDGASGERDDGSAADRDDDGSAWGDRDGNAAPATGRDEPVVDPALLVPVPSARRTVPGRVARVRTDGRAAIPRSAPARVKQAIAAANQIVGRPYKWGGGHARLFDTGYDCSGAVGYALIRSGLLSGSMTSGMLARWAAAGDGRWISVYATRGHVYMEIAGLRLDTSSVGDPAGRSGVRWRPVIGRRAGFHARHVVGL
jgi:cell wall-associated NlpC family hydrolase